MSVAHVAPLAPSAATRQAPEQSTDSPIDRALARVGLTPHHAEWRSLHVRRTHRVGGDDCPLDRRLLVTGSVDEFKRWIGASDDDIRSGARAATPKSPRWPHPPARFLSPNDLSADDRLELRRALAAYVWGDSAAMRAWYPAIVQHAAPFELDVVCAHTIHVQAGATLLLEGRATLLVAREIIIEEGGTMRMTCDGHIGVDCIEKIAAQEATHD